MEPMNTHNRQRKGIFRETLAVVLVLTLLVPGLAAKQRKGNNIVVTRTDTTVVAGELLAVKGTDLLIMSSSTREGITVNLADVNNVRVFKKSKFKKGVVTGLLIGAPVGAILGVGTSGQSNGQIFAFSAGEGALMYGVVFGVAGMLIGGIAGAISSNNKYFQVEPGSPTRLLVVANQLRHYARDRY